MSPFYDQLDAVTEHLDVAVARLVTGGAPFAKSGKRSRAATHAAAQP